MSKELTKEEKINIEEAIEKHWCPFCKDLDRFFSIKTNAWQEFWWKEENKERAVYTEKWGDMLGDEEPATQAVLCVACGGYIPREVWKKWFREEK